MILFVNDNSGILFLSKSREPIPVVAPVVRVKSGGGRPRIQTTYTKDLRVQRILKNQNDTIVQVLNLFLTLEG